MHIISTPKDFAHISMLWIQASETRHPPARPGPGPWWHVLAQLRQHIFSLPRAWPCGTSHSHYAAPWRRLSTPAAVRPAGTGCQTQCIGPGWGRYPLAGGLSPPDTKWPGMRGYTCLWEWTHRCQALEYLMRESNFGRQFEKRCSF